LSEPLWSSRNTNGYQAVVRYFKKKHLFLL